MVQDRIDRPVAEAIRQPGFFEQQQTTFGATDLPEALALLAGPVSFDSAGGNEASGICATL